jgi:DNA-binding winged helix-turn-helix (wHTH) protein/Tol biopolymer transport system component
LPHKYFRFGPFELSKTERVLRRDGALVAIPPKALTTLQVLLDAGGRVLSKSEIIEAVWPNSFVEEASLPQTISILRKLLADAYPNESPIVTVPRVGYSFSRAFEVFSRDEGIPPPTELTRTTAPELILEPLVVATDSEASRPRWPLPSFFVLAVVVAIFFLVRWKNATAAEGGPGALVLNQYTHNDAENWIRASALSPDGKLLAYADSDGVILRVVDSGATHSLQSPPSRDITQVAWYPDGLHLLVSASDSETDKQQLWRLSVTAGAPVLLREEAQRGVPSPDGSHIAFTSAKDTELWVAGPSAESPKLIAKGASGESFSVILWSHDGQHVLVDRRNSLLRVSESIRNNGKSRPAPKATYLAIDAASGTETASMDDVRFESACTLPDNKLLLSRLNYDIDARGSKLWTVDLDAHTGAMLAPPVETGDPKAGAIWSTSCSGDGKHVSALVRAGSADVYVSDFNAAGKKLENVKRLTYDLQADYQHAWTKDSSTVIFESDRSGLFQIYRQALNRRDPEIINASNTAQVFPQLTSDGRWILYQSNGRRDAGPPYKLFRVPAAGGAPVEVTGDIVDQYVCSAHGKLCVVRQDQGTEKISFYALDPITGKGPLIVSMPWVVGGWGGWDVSPDGSTIAVPSGNPGKPAITLISKPKVSWPPSTKLLPVKFDRRINSVRWAADGKGWFVACVDPTGSRLFFVSLAGDVTFLRAASGTTWGNPSPDGKKLAFVDQTVESNIWLTQ